VVGAALAGEDYSTGGDPGDTGEPEELPAHAGPRPEELELVEP
jgi:hypothetical protein